MSLAALLVPSPARGVADQLTKAAPEGGLAYPHPTQRTSTAAQRNRSAGPFGAEEHLASTIEVGTEERFHRRVRLQMLQTYTSMEALLGAYFDRRREVLLRTERACRAVALSGGRRPLSRVWVREAAFWRRFRELIGDAAGGRGHQ